jgi:hypothetical protein
MGLFTTTGKVLPCTILSRTRHSLTLSFSQGKAPAGQRPVECFMCSVTKKSGEASASDLMFVISPCSNLSPGYKEAFEWLERNLP